MIPQLGKFTEQWVLEQARRDYEEGSADIKVDPGHTALLVVDMIDEFVKPNWSPYWSPEATRQVPLIRSLIAAFHEAEAQVIFLAYEVGLRGLDTPTPQRYLPASRGLDEFKGQLFQSVSIVSDLAPTSPDLVILKHTYSGFYGTELDLVLKSLGVNTVVICGTSTNGCSGATARDGFYHGYNVIFGSDVNSTDDPDLHEAELKTLRRSFARVMGCDEIIRQVASGNGRQEPGGPASTQV